MPARAGWCCATPMAARCRTRSRRIVRAVAKIVPGRRISASTPMTTPSRRLPIRWPRCCAGARQIQGTLNGIGERCGNANLVSIIPTLVLKEPLSPSGSRPASDADRLQTLTHVSPRLRRAAEPRRRTARRPMSARAPSPPRPASTPPPSSRSRRPTSMCRRRRVGNRRRVLVSDQAGKSNLIAELEAHRHRCRAGTTRGSTRCCARSRSARRKAMPMTAPTPRFELLARRMLRQRAALFRRRELPGDGRAAPQCPGRARDRLGGGREGGGRRRAASCRSGEGNGPINALDVALRKDLGNYQRLDRRSRARRLQGPHPQRRHGRHHPRADRKPRRQRRPLVHRRRVAQHRRCIASRRSRTRSPGSFSRRMRSSEYAH